MTEAPPPIAEIAASAPARPAEGVWRVIGRRGLHWTPVLLAMVLFAQVALLGLRPALRERERLAAAEVVLRERHARDTALASQIALHLRASQDPVVQERQRRLRELPPESRPERP